MKSCADVTCDARFPIVLRGTLAVVLTFVGVAESADWLSGKPLRRELEQTVSASWTREEPLRMIRAISNPRGIAVVYDRRLDPSIELSLNIQNQSLSQAIEQIAGPVHGHISISDQFVYLGPRRAADCLRTLVEIRREELAARESGIPRDRAKELQLRRMVTWTDLTTPREILAQVTEGYGLSVANRESIPHDLWSGSTLPDVNSIEALTVILIQFDLTFRWINSGAGVELLPIPERVSIERSHRVTGKPIDALRQIQTTLPDVQARVSKGEIVASGSIENQEAIQSLLSNKGRPRQNSRGSPKANLRDRQFTFKTSTAPVSAIMKKIEESDIRFEYNPHDFQSAGINLEQKVQIDVQNVTADQFLKTLFEPLGVGFQIDGTTVKLIPQTTRP